MTQEREAAVVEARKLASHMFRAGDWRIRELIEGRWDHHPDVVAYLQSKEQSAS